jgi:hypothetical protein
MPRLTILFLVFLSLSSNEARSQASPREAPQAAGQRSRPMKSMRFEPASVNAGTHRPALRPRPKYASRFAF